MLCTVSELYNVSQAFLTAGLFSDLDLDVWYPCGTKVDFTKFGFITRARFSVECDGIVTENCIYEGYEMFSKKGSIMSDYSRFKLTKVP